MFKRFGCLVLLLWVMISASTVSQQDVHQGLGASDSTMISSIWLYHIYNITVYDLKCRAMHGTMAKWYWIFRHWLLRRSTKIPGLTVVSYLLGYNRQCQPIYFPVDWSPNIVQSSKSCTSSHTETEILYVRFSHPPNEHNNHKLRVASLAS